MDNQKKSRIGVLLLVAVLLIAAIAAIIIIQQRDADDETTANVTSFAECRDAGGTILESDPEQCLIDGQTFINDAANSDEELVLPDGDQYVGLEEQAALDLASQNDHVARVVQRDGESLPVTMDLRFGRLNFTIEDGVVVSVMVEGAAEDGAEE